MEKESDMEMSLDIESLQELTRRMSDKSSLESCSENFVEPGSRGSSMTEHDDDDAAGFPNKALRHPCEPKGSSPIEADSADGGHDTVSMHDNEDELNSLCGEALWRHPKYRELIRKPQELHILLVGYEADDWTTIAPELPHAMGAGRSAQQAVDDLQIMLHFLKESTLEEQTTGMLRCIPVHPSFENAERLYREHYDDIFGGVIQDAESVSWATIKI